MADTSFSGLLKVSSITLKLATAQKATLEFFSSDLPSQIASVTSSDEQSKKPIQKWTISNICFPISVGQLESVPLFLRFSTKKTQSADFQVTLATPDLTHTSTRIFEADIFPGVNVVLELTLTGSSLLSETLQSKNQQLLSIALEDMKQLAGSAAHSSRAHEYFANINLYKNFFLLTTKWITGKAENLDTIADVWRALLGPSSLLTKCLNFVPDAPSRLLTLIVSSTSEPKKASKHPPNETVLAGNVNAKFLLLDAMKPLADANKLSVSMLPDFCTLFSIISEALLHAIPLSTDSTSENASKRLEVPTLEQQRLLVACIRILISYDHKRSTWMAERGGILVQVSLLLQKWNVLGTEIIRQLLELIKYFGPTYKAKMEEDFGLITCVAQIARETQEVALQLDSYRTLEIFGDSADSRSMETVVASFRTETSATARLSIMRFIQKTLTESSTSTTTKWATVLRLVQPGDFPLNDSDLRILEQVLDDLPLAFDELLASDYFNILVSALKDRTYSKKCLKMLFGVWIRIRPCWKFRKHSTKVLLEHVLTGFKVAKSDTFRPTKKVLKTETDKSNCDREMQKILFSRLYHEYLPFSFNNFFHEINLFLLSILWQQPVLLRQLLDEDKLWLQKFIYFTPIDKTANPSQESASSVPLIAVLEPSAPKDEQPRLGGFTGLVNSTIHSAKHIWTVALYFEVCTDDNYQFLELSDHNSKDGTFGLDAMINQVFVTTKLMEVSKANTVVEEYLKDTSSVGLEHLMPVVLHRIIQEVHKISGLFPFWNRDYVAPNKSVPKPDPPSLVPSSPTAALAVVNGAEEVTASNSDLEASSSAQFPIEVLTSKNDLITPDSSSSTSSSELQVLKQRSRAHDSMKMLELAFNRYIGFYEHHVGLLELSTVCLNLMACLRHDMPQNIYIDGIWDRIIGCICPGLQNRLNHVFNMFDVSSVFGLKFEEDDIDNQDTTAEEQRDASLSSNHQSSSSSISATTVNTQPKEVLSETDRRWWLGHSVVFRNYATFLTKSYYAQKRPTGMTSIILYSQLLGDLLMRRGSAWGKVCLAQRLNLWTLLQGHQWAHPPVKDLGFLTHTILVSLGTLAPVPTQPAPVPKFTKPPQIVPIAPIFSKHSHLTSPNMNPQLMLPNKAQKGRRPIQTMAYVSNSAAPHGYTLSIPPELSRKGCLYVDNADSPGPNVTLELFVFQLGCFRSTTPPSDLLNLLHFFAHNFDKIQQVILLDSEVSSFANKKFRSQFKEVRKTLKAKSASGIDPNVVQSIVRMYYIPHMLKWSSPVYNHLYVIMRIILDVTNHRHTNPTYRSSYLIVLEAFLDLLIGLPTGSKVNISNTSAWISELNRCVQLEDETITRKALWISRRYSYVVSDSPHISAWATTFMHSGPLCHLRSLIRFPSSLAMGLRSSIESRQCLIANRTKPHMAPALMVNQLNTLAYYVWRAKSLQEDPEKFIQMENSRTQLNSWTYHLSINGTFIDERDRRMLDIYKDDPETSLKDEITKPEQRIHWLDTPLDVIIDIIGASSNVAKPSKNMPNRLEPRYDEQHPLFFDEYPIYEQLPPQQRCLSKRDLMFSALFEDSLPENGLFEPLSADDPQLQQLQFFIESSGAFPSSFRPTALYKNHLDGWLTPSKLDHDMEYSEETDEFSDSLPTNAKLGTSSSHTAPSSPTPTAHFTSLNKDEAKFELLRKHCQVQLLDVIEALCEILYLDFATLGCYVTVEGKISELGWETMVNMESSICPSIRPLYFLLTLLLPVQPESPHTLADMAFTSSQFKFQSWVPMSLYWKWLGCMARLEDVIPFWVRRICAKMTVGLMKIDAEHMSYMSSDQYGSYVLQAVSIFGRFSVNRNFNSAAPQLTSINVNSSKNGEENNLDGSKTFEAENEAKKALALKIRAESEGRPTDLRPSKWFYFESPYGIVSQDELKDQIPAYIQQYLPILLDTVCYTRKEMRIVRHGAQHSRHGHYLWYLQMIPRLIEGYGQYCYQLANFAANEWHKDKGELVMSHPYTKTPDFALLQIVNSVTFGQHQLDRFLGIEQEQLPPPTLPRPNEVDGATTTADMSSSATASSASVPSLSLLELIIERGDHTYDLDVVMCVTLRHMTPKQVEYFWSKIKPDANFGMLCMLQKALQSSNYNRSLHILLPSLPYLMLQMHQAYAPYIRSASLSIRGSNVFHATVLASPRVTALAHFTWADSSLSYLPEEIKCCSSSQAFLLHFAMATKTFYLYQLLGESYYPTTWFDVPRPNLPLLDAGSRHAEALFSSVIGFAFAVLTGLSMLRVCAESAREKSKAKGTETQMSNLPLLIPDVPPLTASASKFDEFVSNDLGMKLPTLLKKEDMPVIVSAVKLIAGSSQHPVHSYFLDSTQSAPPSSSAKSTLTPSSVIPKHLVPEALRCNGVFWCLPSAEVFHDRRAEFQMKFEGGYGKKPQFGVTVIDRVVSVWLESDEHGIQLPSSFKSAKKILKRPKITDGASVPPPPAPTEIMEWSIQVAQLQGLGPNFPWQVRLGFASARAIEKLNANRLLGVGDVEESWAIDPMLGLVMYEGASRELFGALSRDLDNPPRPHLHSLIISLLYDPVTNNMAAINLINYPIKNNDNQQWIQLPYRAGPDGEPIKIFPILSFYSSRRFIIHKTVGEFAANM